MTAYPYEALLTSPGIAPSDDAPAGSAAGAGCRNHSQMEVLTLLSPQPNYGYRVLD